jgi:hypothetical protein
MDPFAWNGPLALWLALTIFCGWFLAMFVFVRKAIQRRTAEERARVMLEPVAA